MRLAERYTGTDAVVIASVDADQHPEMADKYQVNTYPTLRLFLQVRCPSFALRAVVRPHPLAWLRLHALRWVFLTALAWRQGRSVQASGEVYKGALDVDSMEAFVNSRATVREGEL